MPKIHNQPLAITVTYSRRLHLLLSLAHLLALIACLSASLPIIYQVVFVFSLIINYLYTKKRIRRTQLGFTYTQATGWQMTEFSEATRIKILPSSILNSQAVFLNLEIPEKGTKSFSIAEKIKPRGRKSVLIMSDTLSADDFRRLIVKLKTAWQEAPTIKPV